LIAVTLVLMGVSLPHALEDFHYGDLMRLGIDRPVGIALLCSAYALQIAGVVLILRSRRSGSVLLAVMGGVWCVGAAMIHGHDMLFAGPTYRHGMISRLLELCIVILGGLAAIIGGRLAKQGPGS